MFQSSVFTHNVMRSNKIFIGYKKKKKCGLADFYFRQKHDEKKKQTKSPPTMTAIQLLSMTYRSGGLRSSRIDGLIVCARAAEEYGSGRVDKNDGLVKLFSLALIIDRRTDQCARQCCRKSYFSIDVLKRTGGGKQIRLFLTPITNYICQPKIGTKKTVVVSIPKHWYCAAVNRTSKSGKWSMKLFFKTFSRRQYCQ